MEKERSQIGVYSFAVLAVAVGVALPLVTKPFVGQSAPYLSFIPAVLLSALYGGFIPGLVTTVLLVISTIILNDVLFTAGVAPATRAFGGFMFVIAAGICCLVIRAMRLAQAAALEAADTARAAEARTQAERDRLEVIVRDLPVGVVIANKGRKVELANPTAIEIHGVPLNRGDDLPIRQLDSPLERALNNNETIVNEELDIPQADGSTRSLMINARPLQEATAIATYSDVTSLRAAQEALRGSEERLRRLFDSRIIGVVSGERDVALESNDSFLEMLGFTREDLHNGRIVFSAFTPPGFEAVNERARMQLEERGFTDPFEKVFLAADGHPVPVMVGAISFVPGKASPWIAWVLDLSEHRRLEERLRQAAKAESIGLLAGGVAHDFNNLLTIIIGNVSMASMTIRESTPARAQVENALRAAERAADLTRQLLAYAGKGKFVVRQADVSEAIGDIGQLFGASAPKEVEVKLNLAPDLPLVSADVTQLQQLVMNLVINGVESLDDRGGAVRVSTSAMHVDAEFLRSADLVENLEPGRYVLIEVSDDGCGMDTDTRRKIFDPFFTTKFTGRGLGLAAAAGIVRAHQGGLMVRSAPGQGSTFQVFLPVVDLAEEPGPSLEGPSAQIPVSAKI